MQSGRVDAGARSQQDMAHIPTGPVVLVAGPTELTPHTP